MRTNVPEPDPMPILHVRNVPARLYARLQKMAEERHRSLTAEILAQLESAVSREDKRAEQGRILDEIDRRRRARGPLGTDSVAWIREDRDREAGDRGE